MTPQGSSYVPCGHIANFHQGAMGVACSISIASSLMIPKWTALIYGFMVTSDANFSVYTTGTSTTLSQTYCIYSSLDFFFF